MKIKFTSEELLGIMKQPKDSCPFFNNIIQIINQTLNNENYKNIKNVNNEIYKNLDNAFDTIKSIKEWSKQWEKKYLDNKILSENNIFIEAYIKTGYDSFNKQEKLKIEKENLIFKQKIKEFFLNIENKESKTIDQDKKMIFDKIEEFRDNAILNREFGSNLKKAYKEISIENDFNDIIQPYEIIKEEQNIKNNFFILGILDHKKTFEYLLNNEYINEIEEVLISKMEDKKKEDFILNKIKKQNTEIDTIFYFKNIEDFQEKKGYVSNKVFENNLSKKQKKTF